MSRLRRARSARSEGRREGRSTCRRSTANGYHRIQGLEDEIAKLDERIATHLATAAPGLLARFGVGSLTGMVAEA